MQHWATLYNSKCDGGVVVYVVITYTVIIGMWWSVNKFGVWENCLMKVIDNAVAVIKDDIVIGHYQETSQEFAHCFYVEG